MLLKLSLRACPHETQGAWLQADYYKTPNATVDDVADAILKIRLNTNNLGRR